MADLLSYWDAKKEEFICPYVNEEKCPYPEVTDCGECPFWDHIKEKEGEHQARL